MAVGQLSGTGSVQADVGSRTLTVEYDESVVNERVIQSALLNVGFESTVVATEGGPVPRNRG